MALDRERVEAAFQAMNDAVAAGDYSRYADLFAEGGTFKNPLMTEPVRGREALRRAATGWPKVVNQVEWSAIDGYRLVYAWNERPAGTDPEAPTYRGYSTVVFDDDGRVTSVESMFDTATIPGTVQEAVRT